MEPLGQEGLNSRRIHRVMNRLEKFCCGGSLRRGCGTRFNGFYSDCVSRSCETQKGRKM